MMRTRALTSPTERGETIKKLIGWCMMLLGLVVLTGAMADSQVGIWLRGPYPPAVSASMTGIDRVSVRADTGLIRVSTHEKPDLTINLQGGVPGSVKVKLVREGSELQVRLSTPWWHQPYFSEPTAVEIRLPHTFRETLAIQTRTAKVELRDLGLAKLTFNGQTGAFRAESVQAREAELRLVTGQIELFHHAGTLWTDLTTGSIEAQFDFLSGPVTVNQTTGKLVLDLPDAGLAGFTLHASVRRGLIYSDLPGESTQTELRATRGAGAHAVNLRVGTGTIDVR